MGLISGGNTIFDAGSMSAGFGGSMVFIKKLTASDSSTLSFVDGASGVTLDNSFKEYLFTFTSIHPATDAKNFTFNFSIDGGSNYNVTKTSTFFEIYSIESGGDVGFVYDAGADLAQSTSFKQITRTIGADNDQCASGFLHLFNPSDTTHIKHFIGNANYSHNGDYSMTPYIAGYGNTQSAIDAVQFKMSSGSIGSGDIYLYGIA